MVVPLEEEDGSHGGLGEGPPDAVDALVVEEGKDEAGHLWQLIAGKEDVIGKVGTVEGEMLGRGWVPEGGVGVHVIGHQIEEVVGGQHGAPGGDEGGEPDQVVVAVEVGGVGLVEVVGPPGETDDRGVGVLDGRVHGAEEDVGGDDGHEDAGHGHGGAGAGAPAEEGATELLGGSELEVGEAVGEADEERGGHYVAVLVAKLVVVGEGGEEGEDEPRSDENEGPGADERDEGEEGVEEDPVFELHGEVSGEVGEVEAKAPGRKPEGGMVGGGVAEDEEEVRALEEAKDKVGQNCGQAQGDTPLEGEAFGGAGLRGGRRWRGLGRGCPRATQGEPDPLEERDALVEVEEDQEGEDEEGGELEGEEGEDGHQEAFGVSGPGPEEEEGEQFEGEEGLQVEVVEVGGEDGGPEEVQAGGEKGLSVRVRDVPGEVEEGDGGEGGEEGLEDEEGEGGGG